MLAPRSWVRLALALSFGFGVITTSHHVARADDDDDEEEFDDSDDSGDDGSEDEDSEDEDGGDEEGDEEEVEEDKDQPLVTAGGLFTLRTFPVREIFRPLTITQNLVQLKAGLGTDISNKGAFESAGVNLEGVYGYRDNFMLLGGLISAYNFNQFTFYGGFEGSLAYDLIDFRLAARVSRVAGIAVDAMDNVTYSAGDTKFSVDIGFPFRYVARPEIAIVALQTLMSIDFNATDCFDDGMGDEVCANEAKPDLNPSIGVITNPIAPLSVVLFATAQITDFDFTNKLVVPATARVQFSPNQKLDVGLEFTLLNIKPSDPDDDGPLEAKSPFDDRFLTLFVQSRFGK